MKNFIALLFFIFSFSFAYSQTIYNHYLGNDGIVNKILIDGDYIYIAGSFEYVGHCVGFGAKLNLSDAKADLNFPKINGQISCVLADGDNGWFIGGKFDKAGSKKVYNFAKIDLNGNIDNGWIKKFDDGIETIIKDGSYLYIGGFFDTVEGKHTRGICRFNLTDKSLDQNYLLTDTTIPYLYNIKIYGNSIYFCDERTIIKIGKETLKIDTNFNFYNKEYANITDFDVGSEGLYFVSDKAAYRCSPTTGGYYSSFKPSFDDRVLAIKLKNQKVYVGGGFWYANNQQKACLARFTYDTGQLESWGAYTMSWVSRLFACKNYLYATGSFNYLGGTYCRNFGRVSYQSGLGNSGWSPNITNLVLGVDESGNYVYVGGRVMIADNVLRNNLYKIRKSDGSLVESFLSDFNGETKDIAIDGNKLYVAGNFSQVKGYSLMNFARIDANSAFPDYEYKLDANDAIDQIKIDGDYIYLYGSFSEINNTQARYLAKINKNTRQIAQNWTPSVVGSINGFIIEGDYVYVYGNFSQLGGYQIKNLGRIRKDNGAIDQNFSFEINNYIKCAVIEGDYIYISGYFWEIGSEMYRHFARINIKTLQVDNNFKYEFYAINSWGYREYRWPKILGVRNGEIYLTGAYEYINETKTKNFAVIDVNQNKIKPEKSLEISYFANCIAFDGNKIFLGGDLSHINKEPAPAFAGVEFAISGDENRLETMPSSFYVSDCYPNPFNSATRLKIRLPRSGNITAKIFDITGRMICEENLGEYDRGEFSYNIDAGQAGLTSGVYYVEIIYADFEGKSAKSVKKLLYIK